MGRFTSWFRQIKNGFSKPSPRETKHSRARFRPLIEQLEARELLALDIVPTAANIAGNAAAVATINMAVAATRKPSRRTRSDKHNLPGFPTGLGGSLTSECDVCGLAPRRATPQTMPRLASLRRPSTTRSITTQCDSQDGLIRTLTAGTRPTARFHSIRTI